MAGYSDKIDLIDRMASETQKLGLAICRAEDSKCDGRTVQVDGRSLLNFGSCSYLGLELDQRVIEAGVDAMRAHGVETSSSRGYLSSSLYAEAESLLSEIFAGHIVLSPTTTLGHLSSLPVLVHEEDAIILDIQVHSSVQMAAGLVKGNGTHVELARHNDMKRLERRVAKLSERHRQVWYMADGIYSMFGDFAPNREIVDLLNRYPKMRYYVDDAHGMSWCGPRGSGSVLASVDLHPRMVLSTGLAKGFGTGGGVIVLPDEEQRRRIQTCGPTMIFSGPIQPPILGAIIESAKIHLSSELPVLQGELQERMSLCDELFERTAVPIISSPNTPVGFMGTGPTEACRSLCARLMDEGFFSNPAQYPATPTQRSGGRFLLTRHHQFSDIERFVDAVDRHWEAALHDAGVTPEQVYKQFGYEPPEMPLSQSKVAEQSSYQLEVAESIDKLDATEWDRLMGDCGCMGSKGVALFENVFGADAAPENQWSFRYYIVRDEQGEPVLATCFTAALWKADMLSPAEVSTRVESMRESDPHFLTQRVFSMGCLLSEGKHLWLRDAPDTEASRAALSLLFDAVRRDAETLSCEVRVFRDIDDSETALQAAVEAEGFMRMPAPESLVLSDVCADEEELVDGLARKHRYHQRNYVEPFNETYTVEVLEPGGRKLTTAEASRLSELYENVKSKSLELNTFGLPPNLIPQMVTAPGWEVLIFRQADDPAGECVGFLASHTGQSGYVPLIVGLDYGCVNERGLYRQVLRQCVLRARALGKERVLYGFAASLEKRRFGARPHASSMFIEAEDLHTFATLDEISSAAGSV
ncbi:MAG: aminotransferase class I/II-fold pyridoxal phosphate-dependent enzyme [Myxococcota bacterium]